MNKVKKTVMIILSFMISSFAYADYSADITAAGAKGAAMALLAVAAVIAIVTIVVGFNTIVTQLKKT